MIICNKHLIFYKNEKKASLLSDTYTCQCPPLDTVCTRVSLAPLPGGGKVEQGKGHVKGT